jgi:subtilisin family serine protease
LREYQNALGPEEIAQYQEDVRLVSLYTHGTHVASIAVQGNPFAQVFAATVIQEHRLQPPKPTEERSLGIAEAYREFVRAFQQQNVRVVNMSWALRADHYERWLAWHGMGDSPEQRQQMAQRYFEIERDALRAAMASAPEILFVAGAGNSADSADFRETIPASLSLPNLITVGAVNMAGAETSFSSFGDTVVVHANGFEVDGLLPGGESTKMSGTSMASPQVANLAGKLLALKPQLSAAEIREAIIKSADPIGRVNLLNPRECAALLGIELDN